MLRLSEHALTAQALEHARDATRDLHDALLRHEPWLLPKPIWTTEIELAEQLRFGVSITQAF